MRRDRPRNAGTFLQADLEGLSIITSSPGEVAHARVEPGRLQFPLLLDRPAAARGTSDHFFVDGVGDTDGVHYVPVPLGRNYPLGLLVVQNGEAPEPDDTSDINGYEFDGATQFLFLSFADALKALK